MKKCCILYNQPGEDALADELDILDQVSFVETHLSKLGISSYRKGITTAFMSEMSSLLSEKPDFVFNLVESIANKGELLYFIPALLNMYSIPYTGNPLEPMFITTSKILTAKQLELHGIPSPAFCLPSQVRMLEAGKKYIVKPIWEDGSMGITSDSVFTCGEGMEDRIALLSDSHWFVQEFIDGREFNISLINGPDGLIVLPPAEMMFLGYDDSRPRIVDYKAKWEHDSFEYINTVRRFPGENLEAETSGSLMSISRKTWEVLGCKGYARVDLRVDRRGDPYVIEVNANPCIAEDGGFVAASIQAGYDFSTVLNMIISDLNQ